MGKSLFDALQQVSEYDKGEHLTEGKAVLAFDKKGNLVGRYKDMSTAKKLKPGHRYETDDGNKEYGVDTERKLASMKTEETQLDEAKKKDKKAPVTDKDDDGDGLDPVGKGDADIDNDGDSDESDKYLKKRRKAISNAIQKVKEEIEDLDEISQDLAKRYLEKGRESRDKEYKNRKPGRRSSRKFVNRDSGTALAYRKINNPKGIEPRVPATRKEEIE